MSETLYTLVGNHQQLAEMVEKLAAEHAIGLDTETTGFEPRYSRVRLLQIASPSRSYLIDLFKFNSFSYEPLRQLLESPRPIKALHNAKFDYKMLKHHYRLELRGMFDTMLADVLVTSGQSVSHSLASCCERYLGIEVDKTLQRSDWGGELSPGQLEYASRDAVVTLQLREKLIEQILELHLKDVAKLEFDCVAPLGQMELNGVYLDADCWRKVIRNVERDHDQIAQQLRRDLAGAVQQQSLFGEPEINLDSPAQVLDALQQITGIEMKGTRAVSLLPLAGQFPVIQRLLEYRAAQKALTSYGENILKFINDKTGRIHADFHQIGAPTGRMSCSNPNLQQVPNSPEYRACFKAPPGRKLIIADYSQIELRILAEFSQDPRFLEAFRSGMDLHRSTASQMFRTPFDEVTKVQRDAAKALNFGLIYGMGAQGLANRIDVSTEAAEELIQKYFQAYHGVKTWLEAAGEQAVRDRQAKTMMGRLGVFNFDAKDRSEVAAYVRYGKNFPIQGTSADITKLALARLHEALPPEAIMVNCIHDEIVVETEAEMAEQVAPIIESAMRTAGETAIKSVPVVVSIEIADSWVK